MGLRALTLWLAILPALIIPFLLGGVTRTEVALSLLINFSALCCALAAGILASSRTRSRVRSLLLAALIAAVFFLLFVWFKGAILVQIEMGQVPRAMQSPVPIFTINFMFETTMFSGDMNSCWADILGMLPRLGVFYWLVAEIAEAFAALLTLVLAIGIAARFVQRDWQDNPASARRLWWQAALCRPVVWVGFFKQWMRRKLELNPIGWLEQRTWSGRVALWGWLALIIFLYSLALTDVDAIGRSNRAEKLMGWLLLGNLIVTAAGSFRRERESGVMELLLVSPIEEGEIITGRLRGLWGQFLPAWVLLIAVWIYFLGLFHGMGDRDTDDNFISIIGFLVSFATLPVIGLYFSLRQAGFSSAVSFTLLAGVVFPVILSYILGFLFPLNNFAGNMPDPNALGLTSAAVQLIIAVLLHRLLRQDLARRNFTFQHAAA